MFLNLSSTGSFSFQDHSITNTVIIKKKHICSASDNVCYWNLLN